MYEWHQPPHPKTLHSQRVDQGRGGRLVLAQVEGEAALIARLRYGTGMRLMEEMRLRIKVVDFDHHVVIVREC